MSLEEAVKPKFAIDIVSEGFKTIVFSVFKSQGIISFHTFISC